MHGKFIFILSIIVTFILVCSFAAFSVFITKFFKIPDNKSKFIIYGFIIFGLLIGFFGLGRILNPFYQGGIRKIFIIDKNNTPQLTVWFTRIHSKRFGADYDQRLRCFELESGKSLEYVQMVNRYYNNDYRIYWLSGKHAWGYSGKTGIQLLDLIKPGFITEEEILLRNPELGQGITLMDWDNLLDPYNHGIRVITKDDKSYQINIDLNAKEINKNSLIEPVENSEIIVNDNIIFKSKTVNNESFEDKNSNNKIYKIDPNVFQNDWVFWFLEANLGKKISKKKYVLSKDSVILLEPEFINELNLEPTKKDKIWIFHKSAIYGDYDPLISFIDANGIEINKINLYEIFNNKKIHVIATYTRNKDVLIFIGIGDTFRSQIKGFTLFALKTNSDTGKIIDKIQYF
jgi:hypothetical protein